MNLMMNLTKRMILMRQTCGKKGVLFFELPYWEDNMLRHNLDVMHIEKNICENIIEAILNADGKSKDNLQSRLDLVDMRIWRDLHPQVLPNGKYRLPPSIFSMSKKEKEVFCMVLKDIKVPMLALRCCMSKNVTYCIIELSNIMKAICGKVLDVEELKKVQDRAALTLCNLEKIFPPSFFTIMVHLVIYLPHEAILGGPIFYRWMYPIERFLSKLKPYCHNKRYPKGSIAEGYLAEECMTFCSRYLEDVETRLNKPTRNAGLNDHNLVETYLFQSYGETIGKVEIAELDDISWIQAHRYVLFHHNLVEPLRKVMWSITDFLPTLLSWITMADGKLSYFGKMRRRRLRDLSIFQNTPNLEEANSEQQTVVGSSNVPETLDEPEEFQTESGGTRRVRGRTLLRDLYDLDPVERVKVSRNTHGQPVGSGARLLASYLGILARNANMLPINYESWHHMPDSNKNQALANIKDRERVGTSSRQKQKFTHMAGLRNFASVAEAEEKLKEKKAEYEAIASTNSSVNLENIDNRIIAEVLSPKKYDRVRFQGSGVTPTQYFGSGSQQYMPSRSQAQAEVQRLRDQIAQMQVNTVEQIAEVQRKYEELQQQLREEAAAAARKAAAAVREAEAVAMAAE
ncbi:hypothetical protein PVK06_008264 [Gossypium arboreum]|uniref:DUF4218 domain-containing protein n=1 Tax=Gossypium arboreum TaxID=29729 RepID=A0ABR0QJH4_GOSAR|nr:hypothetical protein PVK06_008264 [Gossypium arboreum]